MKFLLENGADPNKNGGSSKSLFELAKYYGFIDGAMLLVDFGATRVS